MAFTQLIARAISYVWDSTKATSFSPDSAAGNVALNTDANGNLTSIVETRTEPGVGGFTYIRTTTVTNPTSTQQVYTDAGWVKQP